MTVQAHRGASHAAPENTLEAFALAAEMGAHGIELDIQLTADGHMAVLHDDTVDRTSDGTGRIDHMTLDQARALDFSCQKPGYRGVRIATLDQVLAWAAGTALTVNIEIKPGLPASSDIPRRVLDLAAGLGMGGRILVSSFDHETLLAVKRILPGAFVGALYTRPPDDPAEYARRNGFDAVHPHFSTVSAAMVRSCHGLGIRVHPWTPDEPDALRAVFAAGVDAVITNRLDRALALLKACGSSE